MCSSGENFVSNSFTIKRIVESSKECLCGGFGLFCFASFFFSSCAPLKAQQKSIRSVLHKPSGHVIYMYKTFLPGAVSNAVSALKHTSYWIYKC